MIDETLYIILDKLLVIFMEVQSVGSWCFLLDAENKEIRLRALYCTAFINWVPRHSVSDLNILQKVFLYFPLFGVCYAISFVFSVRDCI